MKLTIASPSDELLHIEVAGDLTLSDFIGLCAVETGFSRSQICLVVAGKRLPDERRSLRSIGLKDEDVVIVQPLGAFSRPRTGELNIRNVVSARAGGLEGLEG